MKNYLIVFFYIFSLTAVSAQTGVINVSITGLSEKGDSLYFVYSNLGAKYYEKPLASDPIILDHYKMANSVPYPQMYRVVFASDKQRGRLMRNGFYFVDPGTTSITTDYHSDGCSNTDGLSEVEFKNQFVPFITKMPYNCTKSNFEELIEDQNQKTDSLALIYVHSFPNSYVALWWLIARFNMYGESVIREKTLESFSTKVKREDLWQILNNDFSTAKIKIGKKFPEINVKNLNLISQKISFPKAKYILIDYWFCRCKPCLDTIPELKKLYSAYQSRGFEIVSISVDMTKNVPLWQQRVKEHDLSWTQYLEENNFIENEVGIKIYPTFILLNDNGVVLDRDMDLHDLDRFLSKNL